jgi:hypothetical protein
MYSVRGAKSVGGLARLQRRTSCGCVAPRANRQVRIPLKAMARLFLSSKQQEAS